MYFELEKVDDLIVDYFIDIFHEYKNSNKPNVVVESDGCCTKNGFQTQNIIGMVSDDIKQQLFFGKFDDKELVSLHMIEYEKEGYQTPHTHEHTGEKFALILYLKTTDGATVLHGKDYNVHVKPKKGTILFFDSTTVHSGEISNEGKMVLVGSIK